MVIGVTPAAFSVSPAALKASQVAGTAMLLAPKMSLR